MKCRHYLLFRMEDGQAVWVYELLQTAELDARLKDGWRLSNGRTRDHLKKLPLEREMQIG